MMHAYNPTTWVTEAREREEQDLENNLGDMVRKYLKSIRLT